MSQSSVTKDYAPADATYLTQTANANLDNEQAMASLVTGYRKNTTGTGVQSVQAIPFPIADGGTNNTSALTAGSVIFSDGTRFQQDNANLFWNDTPNELYLGGATAGAADIKLSADGSAVLNEQGNVSPFMRVEGTPANDTVDFPNLYTSANFGTHTIGFEATMKTRGGASGTIALRDRTAGSNVSGSTLTTTSLDYEIQRATGLSLTTGNEFSANTPSTAVASSTRTVIDITSPTAIEQQINIIDREFSGSSITPIPTDNSLGLISFDPAKYNGTVQVFFEAVIKHSSGSANTNASLIRTSGGEFSLTSVVSSNTNYTRVRSSNLAADPQLISGQYTTRISSNSGTAFIQSARLIILQTASPTLTETQAEVGYVAAGANTQGKKLFEFDPTKYDGITSSKFGATAKVSGGTGTIRLKNSAGITITDLSITSTSYAYSVSADISGSFPSGIYEVEVINPSGQTTSLANAKIVIEQSSFTKLRTYQDHIVFVSEYSALVRTTHESSERIIFGSTGTSTGWGVFLPTLTLGAVLNSGQGDLDFQVKGQNELALLYTDADGGGSGSVGIRTSTPHSRLDVRGGVRLPVRTVTQANATLGLNDFALLMETVAVTRQVALPATDTCDGVKFLIKKIDAGVGGVLIVPNGTNTIDGLINTTIITQWGRVWMQSNGGTGAAGNWMILGQSL